MGQLDYGLKYNCKPFSVWYSMNNYRNVTMPTRKMFTRRTTFPALAVVASAFTLAACGGNKEIKIGVRCAEPDATPVITTIQDQDYKARTRAIDIACFSQTAGRVAVGSVRQLNGNGEPGESVMTIVGDDSSATDTISLARVEEAQSGTKRLIIDSNTGIDRIMIDQN